MTPGINAFPAGELTSSHMPIRARGADRRPRTRGAGIDAQHYVDNVLQFEVVTRGPLLRP